MGRQDKSTALAQPARAAQSTSYTGLGALERGEERWRDRSPFLKKHGYVLRPRYLPEWRPSWEGTNIPPYCCEDAVMSLEDGVLDATQIESGLRVSIKVVRKETNEVTIARMLSSKELSSNPNNHCVPVIDVLPDPVDSSSMLLIMPYLRPFNNPTFETLDEVMDFIRQTLEGLSFIHSQGVAHRDCSTGNIMMDGRPLYPEDHHPVHIRLTPDVSQEARYYSRRDHPVKYYFIDFGMSSHFKDEEPRLVLGAKGADQDAPELSNKIPYDPFMLDIFILGHVYEVQFLQVYFGLEFLEPLVSAMTHKQPERRPTADSALRVLHDIHRRLNSTNLQWRLRKRNETGTERVVYDTISAAKLGLNFMRRGLMGT